MIEHILKLFLFLCYSAEFIHYSFSYLLWLSACPFVAALVYEQHSSSDPHCQLLWVRFIPSNASTELNEDQMMAGARRALGCECLTLPAITSPLSHTLLHLASTILLLKTQPRLWHLTGLFELPRVEMVWNPNLLTSLLLWRFDMVL